MQYWFLVLSLPRRSQHISNETDHLWHEYNQDMGFPSEFSTRCFQSIILLMTQDECSYSIGVCNIIESVYRCCITVGLHSCNQFWFTFPTLFLIWKYFILFYFILYFRTLIIRIQSISRIITNNDSNNDSRISTFLNCCHRTINRWSASGKQWLSKCC